MGIKFNILKALYLVAIHILLVALLLKTTIIKGLFGKQFEIDPHYRQMVAFHSRIDPNLNDGVNIFIGDSLIQGLAVSSVIPNAVNFGIGGDTSLGVLKRTLNYKSIYRAKRVIISVGHNDFKVKKKIKTINNLKLILDLIPKDIEVTICSIFLIDDDIEKGITNFDIINLNTEIQKIALLYVNVSYLDTNDWAILNGKLSPEFHIGDGVHLNKQGYNLWIKQLRALFTEL